MFHMLARAVKLAGLRRSTLPKAIDSGQITGTKCLLGEEQVEHGELHQISPSLTESADENGTHISAARNAGALEAEIAALLKEAQESLRDPPSDDHWVTEQVALQPLPADPNEDHKCSAAQPKNIDSKVKEDCLERRAWDPDIRISDLERISNSLSNSLRPRTGLVVGALLGTLGIGWIFGLGPQFSKRPTSAPVEQRISPLPQILSSENQASASVPNAGREPTPGGLRSSEKIVTPKASVPAYRRDSKQSVARQPGTETPPATQQHIPSSGPAVSIRERRPKILPTPTPFPETRPNTIEGWIVRDVVGQTATLEGPGGTWSVMSGDTVPGVGKVESIVRWGGRWIVATSRGLISTQ